MLYVDACYIGKYYLAEAGSDKVKRLLQGREISCLALGRVELMSAFHRKHREGAIDTHYLAALMVQFEADDKAGLWTWLPVTSDLLDRVCGKFTKLPEKVFLRALDALHLGAAQAAGLTEIHSSDRHLLAAAAHFGLRGVDVLAR